MATGIARSLLRIGCFAALTAPAMALAQAPATPPITIDTAAMTPGSYVWNAPASAPGPLSIMVSIPDQRAYVYQGSMLIAVSTVSTGREGHETPVGSFTVLQKDITHRSNKYDDAPMPYMQRLTWDGVAIHAGAVPGTPASHGCVRVPLAFAKKLYALTRIGAKVEITDLPIGDNAAPAETVDPVEAPAPMPVASTASADDLVVAAR